MAAVDDMATEVEEFDRALALANHRAAPRMKARGTCYSCHEPLGPGVLFCDADCCQDYELEQAAKRRNGRLQ